MYKKSFMVISLSLCQNSLAQNEKMQIERTLIDSNNDWLNPKEGAYKWTVQDLEGVDGTQRKSSFDYTAYADAFDIKLCHVTLISLCLMRVAHVLHLCTQLTFFNTIAKGEKVNFKLII